MLKSVIVLLSVVVLAFGGHYALADDIDLTAMTDTELSELRDRIDAEMEAREAADPKETPDPDTVITGRQLYELVMAYDFSAAMKAVSSEATEMSSACNADIQAQLEVMIPYLDQLTVVTDDFTDDCIAVPKDLDQFGHGCQAYPRIVNTFAEMIVGFPYDNALHYTSIFMKTDEYVYEIDRFARYGGFDIQFQMIDDESWEYSIVSYDCLDEPLQAISFREEESIEKYDYKLTEAEKAAADAVRIISAGMQNINHRITQWQLYGD